MDLNKARALALRLMDEHKVPAKWEFTWTNSRKNFGQAREAIVRGRRVNQIMMSRHLTEASKEDSVRDTILHEIAHVLAGLDAGHGPKWQKKARQIGCTFKWDESERNALISVAKYTYWCDECPEPIFIGQKALSTRNMTCSKHPEATVERRAAAGPEVLLTVV